jgi:hypothetical protein
MPPFGNKKLISIKAVGHANAGQFFSAEEN